MHQVIIKQLPEQEQSREKDASDDTTSGLNDTSKLMNINVMNMTPIAPSSIALNTFTLPTPLRTSAMFENLFKTIQDSNKVVTSTLATLSKTIDHFYQLKLNTSNSDTFVPSQLLQTTEMTLAQILSPAYMKNGIKLGVLAINFNDSEYGFTVDPMSPDLYTEHTHHENIAEATINVLNRGVFQMTDPKSTSLEIVKLVGYVFSGAMTSYGSRFYYSGGIKPYILNESAFPGNDLMIGTSSDYNQSTLEEYFNPYTIEEGSEGKDFYIGAVVTNSSSTVIPVQRMDNSIPNDDYITYPHCLSLAPFVMKHQTLRDVGSRAFATPRLYGVTNQVTTYAGTKLSEMCAMNSDIVCYTLHQNYQNYLRTITCSQPLFIELLNSIFLGRNDFSNSTDSFKFPSAHAVATDQATSLMNLVLFPMTALHRDSFFRALRSPAYVAHDFGFLVNYIQPKLEPFPFLTLEASLASIQTPAMSSTYAGSGTWIATLGTLVKQVSPDSLSIYMALNAMSQFVNLKVIPLPCQKDLNPILFVIRLMGLYYTKIILINVWKRNEHAWVNIIDRFLTGHFPTTYARMFNAYGYGSYTQNGITTIVKDIQGLDKLSCLITNYTINQPAANIGTQNNSLLYTVITMLSLNNDPISQQVAIPQIAYRVAGRIAVIPGQLHAPDNVNRTTPLGIELHSIVDLLQRYIADLRTANIIHAKMTANTISMLGAGLRSAADSIASYHHMIYCPIARKVAALPHLFLPDILPNQADYRNLHCFFDNIKTTNPLFQYNAPNVGPTPIVLLGIDDQLFGDELLGQMISMVLTAYSPYSSNKGMNTVQQSLIDTKIFQPLYSDSDSVTVIKDYCNQLTLRQKYVEALQIASNAGAGTLLLGIPDVNNLLRRDSLLAGPTAAIFSYLVKLFNNTAPDTNAFNMLRSNILGSVLSDPRIYELTLGEMTPTDLTGRTNITQWMNPIRAHVMANAELVLQRVFARDVGIRPIQYGFTISRSSIIGGLTFTTVHNAPQTTIDIAPSKLRMRTQNDNLLVVYNIKVYYDDGVSLSYQVGSPTELIGVMTTRLGIVPLPAYSYVITNPNDLTGTMIDFLTEAVNLRQCVIYYPEALCSPYFQLADSFVASEVQNITTPELNDIIGKPLITIHTPQVLSTEFEYGAHINNELIRNMLPLHTRALNVVMKNMHLVTPGKQFINAAMYPVVQPGTVDTANQVAIDNNTGNVVDMMTAYPFSLITTRTVFVSPPRANIYVSKTYT